MSGPPNVAAFLNHIQFILALLVEEKQKIPEALQDPAGEELRLTLLCFDSF